MFAKHGAGLVVGWCFEMLTRVLMFLIVLRGMSGRTFLANYETDYSFHVVSKEGIIQGQKHTTDSGKEYWAYLGIPFAQPPLGQLRFRAPLPAKPWKGVLDGTKERSGCVQLFPSLWGAQADGSEDCLYINVYTPENPIYSQQLRPVVVWIYGGAFIFGNSSSEIYGPDFLLEEDVIVVTFNYRLGLFGFLSTEDSASPGNYGLKDQNLALKWVQRNIKNFGGDRYRITLAGQSAGAAAVYYHLASPKSKGLFQRAIANSGSSLCTWAVVKAPREIAFDLGLGAGIETNNSETLIAAFRKLDLNTLDRIARLKFLTHLPNVEQEGMPFGPVIEPYHKDAFLTENTFELLESGNFNHVPIMMGVNTMESNILSNIMTIIRLYDIIYGLSPGSLVSKAMNIISPDRKREVGLRIQKHYSQKNSILDATTDEKMNLLSDEQFIRPVMKAANLVSRYTPVYFYVFAYTSDYGLQSLKDVLNSRATKGAAHAEEVWYIWRRKSLPILSGVDKIISLRMIRMWSNFMKYGNPTPVEEELLQGIFWPPMHASRSSPYVNIDQNLSVGQNYRGEHMQFWDDLYKKYGRRPYITY